MADSPNINTQCFKLTSFAVGSALQLQNLETNSKIKGAKLSEEPTFLKFVNSNTLAIVTGTSVFHWNKNGT